MDEQKKGGWLASVLALQLDLNGGRAEGRGNEARYYYRLFLVNFR